MQKEFQMIAKTFKGLEPILADELLAVGANNIQIERRAVSFTGDNRVLYKANLALRTASRVLKPIASFKAKDADEVYAEVKKIEWKDIMDVKTTFAIDATVFSETFKHSRYVTYRVKDAIADYFNDQCGERPSVRITNPDLYINVHIANEMVTISLDSSGESLHKRGYRVATTEAPISEALAAGMILMTGWNGQSDFYDPMCGSGTFLIEAALIARNIFPGIYRKDFAFEHWRDFDKDLFEDLYNDDSEERVFTHKIYGSDTSYYAVQAATKNIHSAGVQRDVEIRQIRLQELKDIKADKAVVMMNPPYGERLAQDKDVMRLYAEIGSTLKHQFTGATAWIISSNEEALKCIGLKPAQKIHLLNGELDCLFNKYELFAGDHKTWKTAQPKDQRKPQPQRPPKREGQNHRQPQRKFQHKDK